MQWTICLLHSNELPLRHVFTTLDGTTKSPDAFSGPIGAKLGGLVSEWDIVNFKKIGNTSFLNELLNYPSEVVEDLSTDQYYAYKICLAVMVGHVPKDIELLEVGELLHSRWITLGCRILRFYVSQDKPSADLKLIAEFCIKVYFPSWFLIKKKHKLTDCSQNFFSLMQSVKKFPSGKVKPIAMKVVKYNAFSAHPENVLLCMLADEDDDARRIAVNKIMNMRGRLPDFRIDDDFEGGSIELDDEDDQPRGERENQDVRRFCVPKINVEAKVYYRMVNLNDPGVTEPPVTKRMSIEQIEQFRTKPLRLGHPCHSQSVERHVKLVSEASQTVAGFEKRDGLIRMKIKSRKLMPIFDTKKDFV